MSLKNKLNEAMKEAMRAKDKARLGTIRLALSAVKQQEVDTRTELDDTAVLAVLDKLIKQRRESIRQYTDAGRLDLAAAEQAEIDILQAYMPQPLSETDIQVLVEEAIRATEASSIKDMGKVMNWVKPKAQGRSDMSQVSALIKNALNNG